MRIMTDRPRFESNAQVAVWDAVLGMVMIAQDWFRHRVYLLIMIHKYYPD